VPDDLADAIYRMVAEHYLKLRVRHLSSASQAGISETLTDLSDIPADAQRILDRYLIVGSRVPA